MIRFEIAERKPESLRTSVVTLDLHPKEDGSVGLVATRAGATGSVILRAYPDGTFGFPEKVGAELGFKLDKLGRIGTVIPRPPDGE